MNMTKIEFYLSLLLFLIAQSVLSAQDIPQECYQFDSDANPSFICDGVCPACDESSFIFTFNLSTFFIGENNYYLTLDDGTIPPFQINLNSSTGGDGFKQEPNENPFGSPIYSISYVLYEGCYSFRITDIFGDGVFDSFGDGFFSLEIDGVEVHSGTNFGIEDVYDFCLMTESCEDGIQNGDETGIDCGGASCEPCVTLTATCEDGVQNGDEQGIDCGGAICKPCDCILNLVYDNIVCNDNGTATPNDDLFTVDVTLTGVGNSYLWNGTLGNQQMIGRYGVPTTFGPFLTNSGSNISGWFMDNDIMNCAVDVIIKAPSNCSIDPCIGESNEPCFTCFDGILNGEEESIDCGGLHCVPCNSVNEGSPIYSNDVLAEVDFRPESLTLFPNPTQDILNVSFVNVLNENAEISITDLNGNILKRLKVGTSYSEKMSLDVSEYASGFYFINLKTESNFESKKFIVVK